MSGSTDRVSTILTGVLANQMTRAATATARFSRDGWISVGTILHVIRGLWLSHLSVNFPCGNNDGAVHIVEGFFLRR